MTLIHLARMNRQRPSSLMAIDDPYTAYCLDEACLYMVQQAMEKREPDFGLPERRKREKGSREAASNAGALRALAALGIEIK